ncbi:hypothetical protein Ddye_021906 [Dipteronia dyeriana]|uniref:Uncharacterized protein n=1 Tax=Dipteronia dyeriana TaxID=168575 RepID=A0AAD9WXB3_9ROSI|nr:hypothetical protein Ddye_021906 [Dipteronia dyeriana]
MGSSRLMEAILDLRASINMISLQVCREFKIGLFKPAIIILRMANNSKKTSVGIVKNVQLDIHGLKVPMDFVIQKAKADGAQDRDWKLLLGRPFMATARMAINVISRQYHSVMEKNKVGDLEKAFELTSEMEKGHHDCIEEKKAEDKIEAVFDDKMLKEVTREYEFEEDN